MSGTLLSDLDTTGGINTNDDSAVQRILNEMNSGGSPPPMPSMQIHPPQVQSRQPSPVQHVMSSPNPNSTVQYQIDSAPPTAHVIGGDHPTSGDFAQMMYSGGRQPQQYVPQNPYSQPMQQQMMYMPPMSKKNWYSDIATEAKTPLLVSLIFFVFSLPFITVLISHYLPSFVKGTGELTTIGLLIKSLLAGSSFWVLHRIVAPLLVSS
jgi:hypothetical protein